MVSEVRVTRQLRGETLPLQPSAQSCSCVDSAENKARTEKRNAVIASAWVAKMSSVFIADRRGMCFYLTQPYTSPQ